MDSMFPDTFPARAPRPQQAWKPTKDCKLVLEELARGPRGEDQLFAQLKGEVTPQRVIRALEALAKNGLARDTGRRSEIWRNGSRCWIWESTPESEVRHAG